MWCYFTHPIVRFLLLLTGTLTRSLEDATRRATVLKMTHIPANTQISIFSWACFAICNHFGNRALLWQDTDKSAALHFYALVQTLPLCSRKPGVIRVNALPGGGFNENHNFLESHTLALVTLGYWNFCMNGMWCPALCGRSAAGHGGLWNWDFHSVSHHSISHSDRIPKIGERIPKTFPSHKAFLALRPQKAFKVGN